jgi:replicative DNA helicase
MVIFDHASAERAVLVGLFIYPDAVSLVSFLRPSHFRNGYHAQIFGAIVEASADGEMPNAELIFARLNRPKWYIEIQRAISASFCLRSQIEAHAKTILDDYARRAIAAAAEQIQILAESGESLDAIGVQSAEILAEATSGIRAPEPSHISEVMSGCFDHLQQDEARLLVPTGIGPLDHYYGGMQRGVLTVLAARPGMGKSTAAANLAQNVGRSGGKVLIAALEDTAHHFGLRMLSRVSEIDSKNLAFALRRNYDTPEGWKAITNGCSEIGRLPIWIDDRPAQTAASIRTTALRHAERHGLDLLIVDHVGELTDHKSAYESVSRNTQILSGIARELNIAVLSIFQLNRSVEAREDKTPRRSDLRDSGRIEEIARCIWFLLRPAQYDPNADPRLLRWIIDKNSHGPGNRVIELSIDLPTMSIWHEAGSDY